MFTQRSSQLSMYQADVEYLDRVGRDSFYGRLAQARPHLFHDDDFAALYCLDNGRPSVPPSLLALALLLQAHDKVSDEEAVERARFDIRWCVALGVECASDPFAKSTLQLFRAHLLLHEQVGAIFQASIEEAKRNGLLRGRKRTIAVDTTPIFGKGAVKDTYNLLATGIVMLVGALAEQAQFEPGAWAMKHDLGRYFRSSIKGEAAIDWDDKAQRRAFLAGIVGDARRLLVIAQTVPSELAPDDPDSAAIKQAAELVCQLLVQDIETGEDGEPQITDGVAADRMPSATDPEMRHGRKSKRSRFDGHKGAIAVDVETGLITAAEVIAGNAPDNDNTLALVEGKGKVGTSVAVGKLLAQRAKEKGIAQVAFDRGGYLYHGRVKALADGARAGGLNF